MKAVIQRVSSASCSVSGEETGRIGPGLVVFLGIASGDSERELDYVLNKILNLRIFPDDEDKMNLSVLDKGFGMLVISQFTLLADCRKGNRPNFMGAAAPAEAERLYEEFMRRAAERCGHVARGRFGAMMDIEAMNAGPVTIIIESQGVGCREKQYNTEKYNTKKQYQEEAQH